MSLEHPDQFGVIPELRNILGIKEDRSHWCNPSFVKLYHNPNLQDKVDRRLVRADKKLRPIHIQWRIRIIQNIPELPNRCLAAPDLIILHYMIHPPIPAPERPMAWDVDSKQKTHLRNLELAIDRSEDPLSCTRHMYMVSTDVQLLFGYTPQKGLIPRWVTAQLANAVHAAQ
ncbi:hypothetical protein B0H11DRAFT_2235919 [Mycena galericulata]|nr:hypothetical protein B0H11DRAFT_2235919 [Mycena galericulata]